VGNDVTANVRTIGSVPLKLADAVDVSVRGEVYLPRSRFDEINAGLDTPYANPRNLASGTLRRVKSADVARVPLAIYVYEGFFKDGPATHAETLVRLKELGFRTNETLGYFSSGKAPRGLPAGWTVGAYADIPAWIEKETAERGRREYEIDGLVVKVDDIAWREELGYTGHHPRWAVAYKFESPVGRTVVNGIDVQVGRTGRITPVARVEPVSVGGTTIANITLHNQAYIDMLELSVGDVVEISRRGDVIPAVERVLEKNESRNPVWKLPRDCPSCGGALAQDGAHLFCRNADCPDQARGRLYFFTGRGQMDIDNLGPETLDVLFEHGFVRSIDELYTFDYGRLAGLAGFGARKIALIEKGIAASRTHPFTRVLPSLGIPDLGQKVTELLVDAGYRTIDALFELSDAGDPRPLESIPGIGEKTAESIIARLRDPSVRRLVAGLRVAGLSFEAAQIAAGAGLAPVFANQAWCVTGSFAQFKPRELAMEEVKKRGGKVVSSVSSNVTHLLAGEGAGSKLEKARSLGITVVSEAEFLVMLETGGDSK
jgi:DNA ligase (NAD+)